MLRDIASIGNGFGGYLLIGVDEDSDGYPTNVLGIQIAEGERDRTNKHIVHLDDNGGLQFLATSLTSGEELPLLDALRNPTGGWQNRTFFDKAAF